MSATDLKSLEALKTFRECFSRSTAEAQQEISALSRKVSRGVDNARTHMEACHAQLSYAKSVLEESEEPSRHELEAVEAAHFQYNRASLHFRNVSDAADAFFRAADDGSTRIHSAAASGARYLDERIQAAEKYLALKPSEPAGSTLNASDRFSASTRSAPTRSATGPGVYVDTIRRCPMSLSELERARLPSLPKDIQWVPMSRINWEQVPAGLEYKYISRDNMETMLKTFERDLLPVLARNPHVTLEELAEVDRALDRVDPDGFVSSDSLTLSFESMIGTVRVGDVVVLDKVPGASGELVFEFSSGRHRALIARALGWKHLPARVLGGD